VREDPGTERIRAAFDEALPLTVGLEEELMLLDPETHALAPVAREVLGDFEADGGDPAFKLELPASQLEIVTRPHRCVPDAVAALRRGRVRPAAAGVHPSAPGVGDLNSGARYDRTAAEFGSLAGRQLVSSLQVHVPCGGAERTLAVYNALRALLPEIAALAANAPFYEGADTGLASVRPKLCELLPRQGVPPPLESWEEYAAALRWGRRSGAFIDQASWWWELRPHPTFGTLELRVPDAQTTTAEAAGVAAIAHCLVASLCDRFDAGDRFADPPGWRIAENRWRAARDGVEGEMADLLTGDLSPTRARLGKRADELRDVAARLGCVDELCAARSMIEENGAIRQRRFAERSGVEALPGWLAERWLDQASVKAASLPSRDADDM
jgi:carboxylate-amine ligase